MRVGPAANGTKFQRTFEALAWRQSQRLQLEPLSADDRVDIAFTLDLNDHPEFGGLQLILSDWTKCSAVAAAR